MLRLSRYWRTLVLGVVAISLGVIVVYRPGSTSRATRPAGGLFAKFDRDGNGIASRSEVPVELQKQFEFLLSRVGQTEIGSLTEAQFQRALGSGAEAAKNVAEASPAAGEPRNSRTVKAALDEGGAGAAG